MSAAPILHTFPLGFLSLGPMEMVMVLVIGIILFGRRFPEVGRSIGRTLTEFRRGMDNLRREVDLDKDIDETRQALHQVDHEIRSSARTAFEKWEEEEPSPDPTYDEEHGWQEGGEGSEHQWRGSDEEPGIEEEPEIDKEPGGEEGEQPLGASEEPAPAEPRNLEEGDEPRS